MQAEVLPLRTQRLTLTPRPYQIEGRDFLAARRHALLADEMRVGKTPQAIMAAEVARADSMLVVCPAIAVTQWQREIERWWPEAPWQRISVVSYDRLRLNAKQYLSQSWDVAIVDEAHFAKNPESQRTKLVYGKDGLGWCSKRLWALSGTPATKHAGELWPMLRAFGVVGATYQDFVRHYCRIDWLSQRPVGTKEQYIPELRAMLAEVMLRRTRKQVAPDMLPIEYNFLAIKPSAVDLVGVPENVTPEWLERHAGNLDRPAVALAKVPALADEIGFAIQNGLLKQTVVFGWHVDALEALRDRLVIRGIAANLLTGATTPRHREFIQREFREGACQVVCANIVAAGTAIDLSAASHGYFLELDWVGGNNVQAANRLVSMEKTEPVTFDICTWPGSADDRVQRVVLTRTQELAKLYSS